MVEQDIEDDVGQDCVKEEQRENYRRRDTRRDTRRGRGGMAARLVWLTINMLNNDEALLLVCRQT